MRAVLQRVSRAAVRVEGRIVGQLTDPGLVVLVGITHDDTTAEVAWMARKIASLRILAGERSLTDLGAAALVISQFTLYGNADKGRRPTWAGAAPADVAQPIYEQLCAALEDAGVRVERGVFGADMQVELVNDGPVTLIVETPATT